MFVHLGGEMVVPLREVVSVLDARLTSFEATRRLVEQARAQGHLRGNPAEAKALVVTPSAVYASPISVATIARRILGLPQTLEAG